MGCLSAAEITEIKEEIADLTEIIDAYKASLLDAAKGAKIKEYRFDSGDGSQKAEYRSPKEINDLIRDLKGQRKRLVRKLAGTGIISVNVRRRVC